MASTRKAVHLFNCDKLCNLSEVEVLLKVVEKKVSFKISPIKKHQFRREQIANMVDQTIPKLKTVDYAVFVVHAGEGCLSFNEDNGYGKIYEALKKRTGSGKRRFTLQEMNNSRFWVCYDWGKFTSVEFQIHIYTKFPGNSLLRSVIQFDNYMVKVPLQ